MKLPYSAVVFDLDGTLTRSEKGIMACAAYALKKMNREVPTDDVLRSFIGPPLHTSFSTFLNMNEEECLEAVKHYRERYCTIGMYENQVYTGIRALLQMLRSSGAYVAIATGKPQEPTDGILRHFALDGFFDKVVGVRSDADGRSTGKKELIAEALSDFRPSKDGRAVMVGDRMFDIQGAKENGIDSIGVVYGYGSRAELEEAGATYTLDTVEELTDLLCPDVPRPRGFFLSVEGLDGSGKSTQVNLLEENLLDYGFPVLRTREPGGSPIAEKIRNVVLDIANLGMSPICEALLYAAARAQHVSEVIGPAVEAGMVVLCDRFVDSSVAYQGGGRQLGVDVIKTMNAPAVNGLMPDATVYIDLDHLSALARRKQATALDRIEVEEASFHGRVEAAYRRIIEGDPGRFLLVDGRNGPEEVGREAFEAVLARLHQREVN